LKLLNAIFFLLLLAGSVNAQSKKEQIEILKMKLDSIENVSVQLNKEVQRKKIQTDSLQALIQIEQGKSKEALAENAELNEKLKKEHESYLSEEAELRTVKERNNELVKEIKKNSIAMLSDTARLNLICPDLVPTNTNLVGAILQDVNDDEYDDLLILYQDTIGYDKCDFSNLYFSPLILEILFFNRLKEQFETEFHCEGILQVGGGGYSEEIYLESSGTKSNPSFSLGHMRMYTSFESESMEFSYNSSVKDFKLDSYYSGNVSRTDPNHEEAGVELDFKENLIFKNNKKIRSINFPAPTLSSWPNGYWPNVLNINL
jgi:hypothetical protein